jgi:hypothetical protein
MIMFNKKFLSLLLLSSMMSLPVSGYPHYSSKGFQTGDEKDKKPALEKKALDLLGEVVREAPGLKLPENRIRIQMTAADLFWKRDEKRARAILGEAVAGIRDLMNDKEAPEQSIQIGSALRQEAVVFASRRDVKLARDIMRATRMENPDDWPQYEQTQWESAAELAMASEMAGTDPDQALEVARETLKKEYSYALIDLFGRLRSSRPEAAAQLLDSIIKKLKSENSAWSIPAASFAVHLTSYLATISQHPAETNNGDPQSDSSTSRLYESYCKELLNMLVSAVLSAQIKNARDISSSPVFNIISSLQQMRKLVEDYAPDRAAALFKKLDSYTRFFNHPMNPHQRYDSVRQTGSVDDLMKASLEAPAQMKNVLLSEAAMKAMGNGDFDRARQIIGETKLDPGQKKQWLEQINDNAIERAIGQNKMDEARQLLSNTRAPEKRAIILTRIASSLAANGDKKLASQLFNEALSIVNSPAANREQLDAQLAAARSFKDVDHAISFDLLALASDRLNEIIAAASVVEGFAHLGLFRDGEISLNMGGELSNAITGTTQVVSELSKSDFDRARSVADGFQREEIRVFARLAVVKGILSEEFAAPEEGADGKGR